MGFSLGGLLKSFVNPMSLMQLAMGPAGWASLAMQTLGTAIAQQAIQIIGKELGLPPAIINMAQTAFTAASGTQGMPTNIRDGVASLARDFNLSPQAQGNLERNAYRALDRFTDGVQRGRNERAEPASGTTEGKKSFLVAFAMAMGQAMDAKMDKMMEISEKIDVKTREANASEGKDKAVIGALSAELQGLSQELSLLSQALSTSVKAAGEAMSTVARKG